MSLENFLLYLFIYILEAGILYWYMCGVFAVKHSKIQRAITISAGYGILFLLSFINSVQINAIAFTLINFIILKLLCCAKWHIPLSKNEVHIMYSCIFYCTFFLAAIPHSHLWQKKRKSLLQKSHIAQWSAGKTYQALIKPVVHQLLPLYGLLQ